MANSTQQYINQYAEYAMEQMRRYGIPASITLAQGLVESGNGNSRLARTANNHFGVKGTFNGAYVLANDDKPNEKFKKYDNVGQCPTMCLPLSVPSSVTTCRSMTRWCWSR